MRAAVAILFICLDLVLSQGSPKRLQIASMTAKIGRDGTGKIRISNFTQGWKIIFIHAFPFSKFKHF